MVFLSAFSLRAAALPVEWQHTQQFDVATPGLVKISLPVETLDAARPALEDLRLYDSAGNEAPFLITRPVPSGKIIQSAKLFQASLNAAATVITLETGLAQPLDGVTLETPSQNFIKAVRVESSADGKTWHMLVQGRPVFRQPYGANQLHVSFPPGVAKWLRLTVDDQRSPPVPFTGARVHAAAGEPVPAEWLPAAITERVENPGETRLALNLGAANLDIAAVQVETDEPLFTRTVTLAMPQIMENGVVENAIGRGVIYRVAIEGQPASASLSVPLETQVRSRELVLTINNGDSPPLPVPTVRVERRPVYLVFLARAAGTYHLLTGNRLCAAPRYDLAALGADLKNAIATPVKISAPVNNPDYRAPEALAGLEVAGAALDIFAWKYRKPMLKISNGGAQQLELGLDVLAHADAGFADLRVMRGSNQVPYLVQRTSISRALKLTALPISDPKNPKLSRWLIQLPESNLPLTRLTCTTITPLFRRTLLLFEQVTDERGSTYRHSLGNADWTQMPERKGNEFSMSFTGPTQSHLLILETENGDNPPIALKDFTAFYPATRVLFKAKTGDVLFLYYGNPRVPPPSYDLSLVAGELLAADKMTPTIFPEEQLKKSSWAESQAPGSGGIVFWGILAVVVVGLLVVIMRLLPKAQTPPAA
ncbi:MAG: DUF3999 family protein [Verrucomicrobiales bacterium]|nr:DUF3999 family protein [Verrucomicrobiales bacterium]